MKMLNVLLLSAVMATPALADSHMMGSGMHNDDRGHSMGMGRGQGMGMPMGMMHMMSHDQMMSMHEHMSEMHKLMNDIDKEQDPAKRHKLLEKHWEEMQEGMSMMMGKGKYKGKKGDKDFKSMPMEERMEGMANQMQMMQMMMNQMMEHEKMMHRGGYEGRMKQK